MGEGGKSTQRVCLGVMVGAHGVRGLVKVKSFTEVPEDVAAYGPVTDETGRREWSLEVAGRGKGVVLVRVAGVTDRDQAQALHGTQIFVARDALPVLEEEETFYHTDLIGLGVEDVQGQAIGRVKAVENFGAGDLLEIVDAADKTVMLPFTKAVVPTVDLAGGRLVVVLPEEGAAPADGEASLAAKGPGSGGDGR